MTIQDVDKEFYRRVLKDGRLMEIRSRMKHGTATFADTAEYNDRTSSILGSVLSGRMPSTPDGERAKLCEYLLRHLYDDTNEMCAAVQQTFDKANGIQIAPQKAPFPAERVSAISGSLEDKTVPMETIQRRAGSAATVGRAFHDAYIQENAKFRTKAGLKCYIMRTGASKCCPWCAEVAGKYEYSAAPKDVFRRHDNCSCTVYYDTARTRQTLQGKLDAEGNRTKTWEVIDEVPRGFEPTVFTDETRPQGFVPTVLTPGAKSGIMKLGSEGMFRKSRDGKIEPMPSKQFQKIVKRFKARGGLIQFNEETDQYLESKHAEAITYDAQTILIRQKPGRASVFEELIHTAQYRSGENDGSYVSRLRCEISAQEKLLRNARAYRLTEPEIVQTQKALEAYQQELDEYLKNGGV